MARAPDPVDVHVGSRVRMRRTLLGLSQAKLGEALGMTFQQVQKYEKGSNRISAGKLHEISRILDIPVAYFFEELPDDAGTRLARSKPAAARGDLMTRRETIELVRAYYRIKDPNIRKRLRGMIKAVAEQEC